MIIEYDNVGAILAVALIGANASNEFDYSIWPTARVARNMLKIAVAQIN